ncbi:MAG TPA: hypothetical protein EYP78_02895 [Candidatus Omnitrophica bacterium]|nr:hypothetical protein [Candidatus Omnitrophota bacterium]
MLLKGITIFLLVLSLCLSVFVFAFRIDKPKFVIQLSEGESFRGTVVIDNPSKEEMRVKVYLEDFTYILPYDGTKSFHPPGSTKISISSWITFSPHEFILKPYARQIVNFTVRPDKDFSTVHCGVLFFESSLGVGADESGAAINIIGRLGSLIFVEPENREKKAKFNDLVGGYYKLKGTFANYGNTFIRAQGTFYMIDSKGIAKDRGELLDLYTLPGNKADVSIPISKKLSYGERYTLVLTYDLGEGDVLVKEIDFSLSSSGEIRILAIRD